MNSITQQYLKSVLKYDPEMGNFIWLKRTGPRVLIGESAGGRNVSGYIQITIDTIRHAAHRLAWLYMTGKWPSQIDHINQIKDDNRWCNLRECSYSQNQANTIKKDNNTSGFKGVVWHKKLLKWQAQIKVNGKCVYCGVFEKKTDAALAYNKKAVEIFGSFSRLNEVAK